MLKKLFILPILGLVGLTSLSYADTVDGYTSDSDISTYSYVSNVVQFSEIPGFSNVCSEGCYMCISSSPIPYRMNNGLFISNGSTEYNITDNNYCFNGKSSSLSDQSIFIANADESAFQSATFYYSSSPITYNVPSIPDTPSDSDNSSVFPTIPGSFTSGITALVNNFGSVIVGRLPTIILVALGITAIFALFRVVRNYARSSFRG